MEELTKLLDSYRKKLSEEHKITDDMLVRLNSVYPFNRFEYVISHLLAGNMLSLNEYISIREDYISRNKYLPLCYGYDYDEPVITESKLTSRDLFKIKRGLYLSKNTNFYKNYLR